MAIKNDDETLPKVFELLKPIRKSNGLINLFRELLSNDKQQQQNYSGNQSNQYNNTLMVSYNFLSC